MKINFTYRHSSGTWRNQIIDMPQIIPPGCEIILKGMYDDGYDLFMVDRSVVTLDTCNGFYAECELKLSRYSRAVFSYKDKKGIVHKTINKKWSSQRNEGDTVTLDFPGIPTAIYKVFHHERSDDGSIIHLTKIRSKV